MQQLVAPLEGLKKFLFGHGKSLSLDLKGVGLIVFCQLAKTV